MLVFATGFDAVDGNYRAMDLRGRGGRHIDDHWTDGPTSYLGVSTAGFPNMFMILGPNGPFTNLPPSIEAQVEWIGDADRHRRARRSSGRRADPGGGGPLDRDLPRDRRHDPLPEGATPGSSARTSRARRTAVMFYMAGIGAYRQQLAEVAGKGYEGFALTRERETAGT